ncbi:hypothetical protein BdWA1_001188 [Babesia duncani]|nr:hypothetical protein BdWA1_001188 [Babesia duncani]
MRRGKDKFFSLPDKPPLIIKFIEGIARSKLDHQILPHVHQQVENVLNSMISEIDSFTVVEIRTICHGIARIYGQNFKNKLWAETVATFTLRRAKVIPVFFLFPLVNSLYRIGYCNSGFEREICEIAINRMHEANSIDLATIAQTAIKMKCPRDLLHAVSRQVLRDDIIREISATNAVFILYSFGKCSQLDLPLFETLLDLIGKIDIGDFEVHLVPLVLHAIATFKLTNFNLDPILRHATVHANLMETSSISSCIYSLAKLEINNESLIKALIARIWEVVNHTQMREICNIIWGLSKLRYHEECTKVAEHALSFPACIDDISFGQLFDAIVVSAPAANRLEVLNALMDRYMGAFPIKSAEIMGRIAWSTRKFDFKDKGIIEKTLEELSSRKLTSDSKYYFKVLGSLGSRSS